MAGQQFYRPDRRRPSRQESSGDPYDTPGHKPAEDRQPLLDASDKQLSNIDDVLAENDATMQAARETSEDATDKTEDGGFYRPDQLADAESKAASGTDGAAATEQQALDKLGAGYTGKGGGKARGRFSRRQKFFGGGIAGGGVGIALFAMITMGPILKLENFMQNINRRAFAYAASAVEARTEHLFKVYMIKHVTSLNSCTTVRSIDCRANYAGTGMAGGLFTAWRDARIEEKLFDEMGFSVESTNNPDRRAGVHRFTLRDRRGSTITFPSSLSSVGDWDGFVSGQFTGGSREMGRELRRSMRKTTRWYQVMERHSVRTYLQRKHGIRSWCFFACKSRDNLELRTADSRTRLKYYFLERMVYPVSGKYGFVLDCIMSGATSDRCSARSLRQQGIDRDRVPDETVNRIIKEFKDRPDMNLSQFMIRSLLEKVMSKSAAQTTVSAIPVAGQVYLALTVIDMIDKIDGAVESGVLGHYAAEINSAQYREYYASMRSFNDEMKSHAVSLEDVGAVMADLEGAEQSKLYQAYNPGPTTASLFGGTAYAQETQDEEYTCADGEPLSADEYVCEEKRLDRTFAIEDIRNNRVVDGLLETLNVYDCAVPRVAGVCAVSPKLVIRPLLNGIDKVAGKVFGTFADVAMSVVRAVPGAGSVIGFVEDKFSGLLEGFFGTIFPLPLSLASPGRDKVDGIAAGADITASEFGQGGYTDSGEGFGLGAPQLSPSEATAVYQDYMAQYDYERNQKSFLARLTDPHDSRSLAGRAIMEVPNNSGQVGQSIASILTSPFRGLASLFGAFSRPASAATYVEQNDINAFGVTRYGYALDDPLLTQDPGTMTPEYCEQAKAYRDLSASQNPDTGFDEYSVANPCLLEQVVLESAGAYVASD